MTARDLPRRVTAPSVKVILGWVDVALGCLLMLLPAARLSSPTLTAAHQVMAMKWWGLLIAIIGVAILTMRAERGVALSLGAAWLGFFTATLIYSATQNPTAGVLALPLYVLAIVLHLLDAAGRVR